MIKGVRMHARACVGVRGCARMCAGVCGYARACANMGVTEVSGFSNNHEFSEYLLETNVFMQWPLIRILFEFLSHNFSIFGAM